MRSRTKITRTNQYKKAHFLRQGESVPMGSTVDICDNVNPAPVHHDPTRRTHSIGGVVKAERNNCPVIRRPSYWWSGFPVESQYKAVHCHLKPKLPLQNGAATLDRKPRLLFYIIHPYCLRAWFSEKIFEKRSKMSAHWARAIYFQPRQYRWERLLLHHWSE